MSEKVNLMPQIQDEDNDDLPVGRVLSRREILALLGGMSAATWLGKTGYSANSNMSNSHSASASGDRAAPDKTAATRGCVARPELTEGPFFVDEGLNRSDIRSDPKTGLIKAGVPLDIVFNVSKVGDACAALAGAIVDVWHCDALGLYSDVGQNGTQGQQFLRGSQTTDAAGVVKFKTIFPGWYEGRAVHIHFKIRVPVEGQPQKWSHEFTSQFFFDEALTREIYTREPYAPNGAPGVRNERDGIFNEGGKELILDLKKSGDGYRTTFDIALDLTRPSSSGQGGPGGGRGPGRRRPPRDDFGRWGGW